MPFNSDTYHANKSAKRAWAIFKDAREAHAAGRLDDARRLVADARFYMRLCLTFRPIGYHWKGARR